MLPKSRNYGKHASIAIARSPINSFVAGFWKFRVQRNFASCKECREIRLMSNKKHGYVSEPMLEERRSSCFVVGSPGLF